MTCLPPSWNWKTPWWRLNFLAYPRQVWSFPFALSRQAGCGVNGEQEPDKSKRTFWSRVVVEMVFHSEDRHRSRTPILLRKIREDWVSKIDPCRSATSNFKIGEVLRCNARFKLADIVSARIFHVKVLYRVNLTFKRFRGYQSTFILLD